MVHLFDLTSQSSPLEKSGCSTAFASIRLTRLPSLPKGKLVIPPLYIATLIMIMAEKNKIVKAKLIVCVLAHNAKVPEPWEDTIVKILLAASRPSAPTATGLKLRGVPDV
jgi:hypothetical protein